MAAQWETESPGWSRHNLPRDDGDDRSLPNLVAGAVIEVAGIAAIALPAAGIGRADVVDGVSPRICRHESQ